jgi:uncharacterized protein YndB with AHSA1/START domain
MRRRDQGAVPVLRRRASVRLRRRFRASAQRVFGAWLDPHIARHWLFATAAQPMAQVEIDPRIAGAFRFVDRHAGATEYRGRYTALERPQRLAFSLAHDHDGATHVTVDIEARPRGCEVVLTHEAVPGHRAAAVRDRWMGIMHGLALVLDAQDSHLRSER